MREVEEASRSWPAAFVRRKIGTSHVVALDKRDVAAPVPVIRTAWLQTFSGEQTRDAFYDWLCGRVDRWAEWADLAWSESGTELTCRLLELFVTSTTEASRT